MRATSKLGVLSILVGSVVAAACGDDDEAPVGGDDAGADASASSGGRGSGGRSSSGGSQSGGATGTGGNGSGEECTMVLAVPCDGPEDCPGSQQCCGRFEGMTYTEIGCFDSCATAAGDAGAAMPGAPGAVTYLELCHSGGDACSDEMLTCGTSMFLGSFLERCWMTGEAPTEELGSNADEVNCGESVCGEGEQCCIRAPKEPYCAPAGAECECDPMAPEAGAPEAGVPEAGSPDVGSPDAESDGAMPEGDAAPDVAVADAPAADAPPGEGGPMPEASSSPEAAVMDAPTGE